MLTKNDQGFSTNTLLYFLPSEHSIDGENTLTLKYPQTDEYDIVTYEDKEYPLIKETFSGMYENLTTGDIVPNRLAIIRLDKILNKAILLNSPVHGSLQVTQLEVVGDSIFNNLPKYRDKSTMVLHPLVTSEMLDSSRIKYGTEEADMKNYPEGTVYFKLEE